MASFTAGTTFVDGVSNDVTAAKLGNLVTNATPTSGFIQDRTAETVTATNDTLLIGDASDSNNLKRITVANFTQTLPTAKVTTGTIETGTFGTTTSTAATITTGTIPTLVATTLITTGTGTAAAPAIVPTGDTNTGIFFPAADTIAFSEGGTEGMRIDSSGKVLIGTTSNDTGGRLEVKQGSSETGIGIQSSGTDDSKLYFRTASGTYGGDILFNGAYLKVSSGTTELMRIDSSGNVGIGTTPSGQKLDVNGGSVFRGTLFLGDGSSSVVRKLNASTPLTFANQGGSAEMTIDGSGNVLMGKTSPSTSTVGFQFDLANQKIASGANGGASAFFNRNGDDGMIVQIAQDGTVEGTISVSGTTVSYNGGNLSRFSQLPSGQRDPAIKKGTVLSNLDAMCEWRDADGNLLQNEQLNKVKISDVESDSNTAGVFVNWDNDDQDNPYDLNMAMTGDMIIRIAQGTSVNRGDLLMSAGDGTAKPQGDDIIRSKTIAKVTSTNVTCTYEDGSYCVPCVLMAC